MCLFVLVYNKVEYRTPRCHCNTSLPGYTGKLSTLITSGFGERELQEPTETFGEGTVLCIVYATEHQGQYSMCVSIASIHSYSMTHWIFFSIVIWQTETSSLLRTQRIITLNVSLVQLELSPCRVFTIIPSMSRSSSLPLSHTF